MTVGPVSYSQVMQKIQESKLTKPLLWTAAFPTVFYVLMNNTSFASSSLGSTFGNHPAMVLSGYVLIALSCILKPKKPQEELAPSSSPNPAVVIIDGLSALFEAVARAKKAYVEGEEGSLATENKELGKTWIGAFTIKTIDAQRAWDGFRGKTS